MKKLLYIFLLFAYEMNATWVVVKIDNQSDLQFTQAARNNDVVIQSISNKIQSSDNLNNISFDEKDQFGTVGGCRVVAVTPEGVKVSLRFLGDPTYRVANGRARYSDLNSRLAAGLQNKAMMARVMLEEQGVLTLIGSYCGYEQDNQPFAITINGSNGTYHVQLTPIVKNNVN